MSIVERLFNIVRSVVQEKLDTFRPGSEQYRQPSDNSYRQRKSSRNQSETYSNEDPELARCYANLELPYGSDYETVHKAWKKMVRQYHPDMHSGNEEKQRVATELLQGLNEAHDILKKHLKG